MPRGAQLLSSVRQAPGGGRDLYASPDGGVYQRRNDGWYRRQPEGRWAFYAPTQGTVDHQQLASGQGMQTPSGLAANRSGSGRAVSGTARAAAPSGLAAHRPPNSGVQPRAQQVSDLERQYYARALGQMKAQNWRAANVSRPVRAGGRRR